MLDLRNKSSILFLLGLLDFFAFNDIFMIETIENSSHIGVPHIPL